MDDSIQRLKSSRKNLHLKSSHCDSRTHAYFAYSRVNNAIKYIELKCIEMNKHYLITPLHGGLNSSYCISFKEDTCHPNVTLNLE